MAGLGCQDADEDESSALGSLLDALDTNAELRFAELRFHLHRTHMAGRGMPGCQDTQPSVSCPTRDARTRRARAEGTKSLERRKRDGKGRGRLKRAGGRAEGATREREGGPRAPGGEGLVGV